MPLTHLLLLAVIQGIAEFLPISSSGHVVVAATLLGNDLDIVDVNIVLHLGTLVAILIFYVRQIWRLLTTDRRVIPLLVVATIPAAALGVLIKSRFEWLLEDPLLAGCMLVLTGLLLVLGMRLPQGDGRYQELSWRGALAIGSAQAFALLPGISRSGTTIVAGLGKRLSAPDAATFSFLLAIPAIGGASTLELIDLIQGGTTLTTPVWQLALAALVSCLVGLWSLRWLVRCLERGNLHFFSIWCIAIGLMVIVWQLMDTAPPA